MPPVEAGTHFASAVRLRFVTGLNNGNASALSRYHTSTSDRIKSHDSATNLVSVYVAVTQLAVLSDLCHLHQHHQLAIINMLIVMAVLLGISRR